MKIQIWKEKNKSYIITLILVICILIYYNFETEIKDFIYTETKSDNPITRYQSFMGGIITTHKTQDEFGVHSDKVIKLLNLLGNLLIWLSNIKIE